MATIAERIDLHCVCLELEAKKKEEAISELVGLLARAGKVVEPAGVHAAVLEREKMVTTGIGDGVAIPHARIAGIEDTVIAFGRKKKGLAFGALDGKPVSLLFLLVSPKSNESEQLKLLSTLARLLRSRSVRKSLLAARSAEEVISVLREEQS